MDNNYYIIAHRGVFNNKDIPENSLAAFKKAVKLGYPIELDVQLTKDNKLVILHDSNTKRMTGIDINIHDAPYAEIKKLHLLDTKEVIPTLKEVLDLVDSKVLLDIEVKDTDRILEVCTLLMNELSNYSNFILKSFNPKIVRYLKKHYPTCKVGYLMDDPSKEYYSKYLTSIFVIKYSKADFLAINKKLIKLKRFKKLSKKHPIYLWTIKSKEEFSTPNYVYICNNLPY